MSNDEMPDLWPVDLLARYIKTPKRLLTQQASHLNRRGGSFVQCEVRSDDRSSRANVSHEVWLVCNEIESHVLLFRVDHSSKSVYPCHVNCVLWEPDDRPAMEGEDWRTAHSEDDLTALLKEILQSGFVRSVVESMQAQALEHLEERG